LKRSRLSYDEWKCIKKKKLKGKQVNTDYFKGYIGILEIEEVTEKQIWKFDGEDIVVCDSGLKWISILPQNDFYCITAMMSAEDDILLWYVDMIAEQGIDTDSIPYFDDLYLDLVVYPDGTIKVDDMDELADALSIKQITEEQFNLAINTSEKLTAGMLSDVEAFAEYTYRCYDMIKESNLLKNQMKKILIFDAYGTLISTGNGSIEATKRILALQDKEIDAKAFYSDWKKYHRKHIEESNRTFFVSEKAIFEKDLKALYKQYQINRPFEADVEIMLKSLENRLLFPEVMVAIDKLRERYRVVIGSTTDIVPLMQNLAYNCFMVDKVYTSEMIQKYKPDKAFYEFILHEEGVKPEEAIFIGDSMIDDVEGPQSVGITAVLVDRQNKYNCLENIKPDYIVHNMEELGELLHCMIGMELL